MKASLLKKLDVLSDRYEELTALLGDAEVISDQTRFRAYSREYAEVEPVILAFRDYRKVQADLEGAQALLKDSDPELRDLAEEEVAEARGRLAALGDSLQRMLLPKDPNDSRNVFLEIRAGTGGDEAAIFSGDLFRMYSRYAERQGWRVETLSENEGEHGGYKEVIARVEGDNVYAKLKFESGAHRVQRVPETESQGRIHTSACTVAVLPEPDEQATIEINPADLRVDTYRSSMPAASTSTRPTRRCASPTFPAASWSSARKSARSTRTAPRPWPGWRPSSTTSSRPRRSRRSPARASCWWARATARSASVPTTSRKGGSPTIASTLPCTPWAR